MTINQLFSLPEALSRLGQIRAKGCILVYNSHAAIHIFVEEGFIVGSLAGTRFGESALDYALKLTDPNYIWSSDVEPLARNLKLNIQEYVIRHALVQDVKVGLCTQALPSRKVSTKTDDLAMILAKKPAKLDFVYSFVSEEDPPITIRLAKATSVVGRDEYCDVVLQHPQVSRKHCLLQATERGVLVKDLDSTNGTYANGIPFADGYVNPGDTLSLGSLSFSLKKDKKTSSRGQTSSVKL